MGVQIMHRINRQHVLRNYRENIIHKYLNIRYERIKWKIE